MWEGWERRGIPSVAPLPLSADILLYPIYADVHDSDDYVITSRFLRPIYVAWDGRAAATDAGPAARCPKGVEEAVVQAGWMG